MKVENVQPTPNPNAFKFILDGKVVARGVKNYTDPTDATHDPLGTALFAIQGVDTLFFCENFVTLSMVESADWRTVHDAVVKVLEAHDGAIIEEADPAAPAGGGADVSGLETDTEVLQEINALLDDRVRPALAGDGGGLEVLGMQGKTLHIRYQGACGSCPSSVTGTLMAIQNLIQTEVDETMEVISA